MAWFRCSGNNVKINHYNSETALTVVSNPTSNTKKIMFGGKPKALFYSIGTGAGSYNYQYYTAHNCYWDNTMDNVKEVSASQGNGWPVIEVGKNYIVLDTTLYGGNVSSSWNYFGYLTTISE